MSPGEKRRRKARREREAAVYAAQLAALPAGARCDTCEHCDKVLMAPRMSCDLGSDFHGYAIVTAHHRCPSWKERWMSDIADLVTRIDDGIRARRFAEMDRIMFDLSRGTIKPGEWDIPMTWLRTTFMIRGQFPHWTDLRDRMERECAAINDTRTMRGLST